MIIVARDGSGDYTSVQAAVDAVKGGGRAPAILLVRKGTYHERVIVDKDNLRIVGEDPEETIITNSACAKDPTPGGGARGTFLSFTVIVTGRNVEIENLTIRNDAGDGRNVGQAVALFAAGDRGVYRGCRLIAHQDTLFTGPMMPDVAAEIEPRTGSAECKPACNECDETYSRLYFEDCLIRGDIDFIFGSYRCWFERCTLYMNERGGYYTAANTPRTQPYGYVFHRCRLTGECADGAAYLGRPWRKYARTLFLDCEMDACVAPEGFTDWDENRRVTDRCGEYGTTGARANQAARHPEQKRLTAQEAMRVTILEVIGGWDNWRPDLRVPTWFMCGDSTMANYSAERSPMAGWGQMLQSLLTENVYIENCAINGRSSKSFIDERWLENISACLRPGDRLIVSFSHNDEKADPARHTDPHGSFPEYLDMYIDAAQKAGVEAILATPIARRRFNEQGQLTATHGEYPDALRRLAEKRGVRLIDLEKATMRLFQEEGIEGTKKIFCHLPAGTRNYPDGAADDSHMQLDGATRVAALFLERLEHPEITDGEMTGVREEYDCSALIDREDSVVDR